MRRALASAVAAVAIASSGGVVASSSAAVAPSLSTSGRTVTVVNPPATQEKAKFYDVSSTNSVYLGADETAPYSYTYPASTTKVQVRLVSPDLRLETVLAASSSTPTPAPAPAPAPTPAPAPAPAPGTVPVATVAELESALTTATPGTVIELADGVYMRKGGDRWVAAPNGTASAPITLRGSRSAILQTDSPTGDYGLHITGDYWHVDGITVRNGSKGIVLDGSVGSVISNVEVADIGAEGVHFRACSSDGTLVNSYVHDTGLASPQFGEGVYVGSASSNWGSYGCASGQDDTERTLVAGNVFRTIPAEGADLKEGTDSGTLVGNTFDNVGFSGQNSADSAVDAKGNNWFISSNTVLNASGSFLDGFQTHTVYSGYGTGNVFRSNSVLGAIAGYGFGLYPRGGNVVACNNSAPGAAKGLVGVSNAAATCS